MERRLVLFGRRPILGRVKTRLVPPLSPEQALELYRAFLADQLRFVRGFAPEARVEWCADGPVAAAPLDDDLTGIRTTQQGPGDLGERLLRAFRRSRDEGSDATVVIGTDSPTIPAELVTRAFDELRRETAPAVLAPADDGGYVLIGMKTPLPQLFAGIAWGGAEVAEATRCAARTAAIPLGELAGWYDVDDRAGLLRLASELREEAGARSRAPATARLLDSGRCAVV